jgi:cytochrome c6
MLSARAGPRSQLGSTARIQHKLVAETMKRILTISVAVMAISALSAAAGDAKALYEQHCTKCHGADGKGDTKMGKKYGAKDYSDAKVQAELKDDAAFKAIKEGYKDSEGKVIMKPAEDMSDDDIKGLVAYMRTFKK